MSHAGSQFLPLQIAVLTISDSRTEDSDSSGQFLRQAAIDAGHRIHAHRIVKDDVYLIRAAVSEWIAAPPVQAIITTGGTGYRRRDITPDALLPLFDREIVGFGELFRAVSAQEIGSSTLQSRATAGIANHRFVFCLPGSTGACRTAWDKILREQLDTRHRPCNFAEMIGEQHD